ncbi:MAG: hypothetical protein E7261_00770 [Lachnospiraceae bacterium]|nr:hypothetical protein [Lachnospiraceae bacterium]
MKKNTIVKILTGIVVLAAIIAGAFVIYKNFIAKPVDDEDFDDDFEDEEDCEDLKREYVSIPFEEGASATADVEVAPAEDTSDITE